MKMSRRYQRKSSLASTEQLRGTLNSSKSAQSATFAPLTATAIRELTADEHETVVRSVKTYRQAQTTTKTTIAAGAASLIRYLLPDKISTPTPTAKQRYSGVGTGEQQTSTATQAIASSSSTTGRSRQLFRSSTKTARRTVLRRMVSSDDQLETKPAISAPATSLAEGGLFQYANNLPHKGVAVIFNYYCFAPALNLKDRPASFHDAKMLKEVLSLYKFQTFVYDNLILRDLLETLKEFARSEIVSLTQYASFVCVLLTHGAQDDVVYAYDAPVNIRVLAKFFEADNCAEMEDKPKIFIIQLANVIAPQACRGSVADDGVVLESGIENADDQTDSPGDGCISSLGCLQPDFLFAFSTPAGYLSFKNSERGSYFIFYLHECMMTLYKLYSDKLLERQQSTVAKEKEDALRQMRQLAARYDILWLMRCVSRQISFNFVSNCVEPELTNKKQVPCIVSTLRDEFWLLPVKR